MTRRAAERITVPPPEVMARAAAMTARGVEPRGHHTVPRFYLRRWASDDIVRVTSVEAERRSYLASTAKASIVNDFYRLDVEVDAGVSPVAWEAWHSEIETRAAPVFETLRDRDVGELGWEDRLALCTFLAAFHTRSRGYVERARQDMVEGQRAVITGAPDSALAKELRRRNQPADAEAVARARAEMLAGLPGFKSAQRTRTEELGMAAEAAATIAVLLFMRRMAVYNSPRPVLTCDEPLIELQPDMGQQPEHSGGIWGAPFLLFPLGPRQVLVLARSDLPVTLPTQATLTGLEALDVNSVVVGNADRVIVAEPELRLADQLYIPGISTRAEARTGSGTSNSSSRVRAGRRWHGERDAPQRPVARLWPHVLPPAPPMPEEMRQSLKRLRANQG